MELLNKREMAMVKELARELIIVQKQKSKENIIRGFNKIKNAVTGIFNKIKSILKDIWEPVRATPHKTHKEKTHDYNWHVPLKMEMPKPPDLKIIRMSNVRSSI